MNNEMILLGIAIIALLLVWKFMVRRTVLDNQRDKLFDLRDDVRRYYLDNGYGLEDRTYAELRKLINNQIRFLDKASMSAQIYFTKEMESNPELKQAIHEHVEERFATDNEELAKYIKAARSRAFHYTMGYLINSSIFWSSFACGLVGVIIGGVFLHHSFKVSKQLISEAWYGTLQKGVSQDSIERFASIDHSAGVAA